jgi:arsenate reductase-like glutaredoxin family protein
MVPARGLDRPARRRATIEACRPRQNEASRSSATRFFKERRVRIHQVDLTRKPIARGELRRFVDRLGARSLLDETSRAYQDGGLGYMRLDDAEIVERLLATPALLRLPLVRFENDVATGRDETAWKRWFKPADDA